MKKRYPLDLIYSILCIDGKCEKIKEFDYIKTLESKILSSGILKFILYHLDFYDFETDKLKRNFERVNFISNLILLQVKLLLLFQKGYFINSYRHRDDRTANINN
jgi:hypothetical protein